MSFIISNLKNACAWTETRIRLFQATNKSMQSSLAGLIRLLQGDDSKGVQEGIVPEAEIKKAKTIVYINQVRVGKSLTGVYGHGIAMSRLDDTTWSMPYAIKLYGLGFGCNIGLEFSESVLLLPTDATESQLFTKTGRALNVGGYGKIVYGNSTKIGGETVYSSSTSANRAMEKCYLATTSSGLFAGLSVSGAYLAPNDDRNKLFFGSKEDIDADQVLVKGVQPSDPCPEVATVHHLLNCMQAESDMSFRFREKSPDAPHEQ